MQGPETLYFFTDNNGVWWYVQNDLVLSSPSPVPLQYTPDGWEDIGIMNQRNQKYFLMDRSFSVPLEFVEDGARILKYKFYNRGLGEKLLLVIAKQKLFFDATHYGFYYTLLYKGEVDFSEFSHEGPKVVLNIMEGGIVKFVKGRENVKYKIPIDAPDTIKIKWDGINLKQTAKYLVLDPSAVNLNGNHSVPLELLGQETIDINLKSVDRVQLGGNSGSDQNNKLVQEGLWFYKASTNIDVGVKWNFNMTAQLAPGIPANPAVQLFLVVRNLRDDGSIVVGTILQQFNGPADVFRKNNFNGQATITGIEPGSSLYLFMGINIIGESGDRSVLFFYDNTEPIDFEITNATYRHRTTFVKARRPFGFFQDLTSKVSDGTVKAESNVLNTHDYFVVTSGDAIRGLPDSFIKASLYDNYKSFNTIHCIGMGAINGKLKLEKKVDCVDYSAPIALGEGKGLKVKFDKDYDFSSIKIGCPEQKYDDVNGKQEFNNTHVYTTPNSSDGKELDLVSVFRFDCYGAEFTRINMAGKTTTDSESDNDVWVIAINPIPINDPVEGIVYELDRSLNPYATGLLEPATVFNLALSPKQCLFRNGPYIRSCFYKQDAEYLRFQTTEKNSSLEVAPPGGPVITEAADVEIAKLGDRLFVPVKLQFDTRVPNDLLEQLAINPLNSYATSYVGIPLVGIPNKTGIHPEDNEAQSYELLASPNTDLTQLIDVFE